MNTNKTMKTASDLCLCFTITGITVILINIFVTIFGLGVALVVYYPNGLPLLTP